MEFMPLALSLCAFSASVLWLAYGILVRDVFVAVRFLITLNSQTWKSILIFNIVIWLIFGIVIVTGSKCGWNSVEYFAACDLLQVQERESWGFGKEWVRVRECGGVRFGKGESGKDCHKMWTMLRGKRFKI